MITIWWSNWSSQKMYQCPLKVGSARRGNQTLSFPLRVSMSQWEKNCKSIHIQTMPISVTRANSTISMRRACTAAWAAIGSHGDHLDFALSISAHDRWVKSPRKWQMLRRMRSVNILVYLLSLALRWRVKSSTCLPRCHIMCLHSSSFSNSTSLMFSSNFS